MAKRGMEALTPEVQEIICKAIRAGNYPCVAAAAAGISARALRYWMEKGRKATSGKYFLLCRAVKKAEADAQVHAVAIIRQAMGKSWQASAWWLERKYPEQWAQKQYVEQKNIDGGKDEYAQKAEKSEAVRKALLDLQQSLEDDERDSRGSGGGSE